MEPAYRLFTNLEQFRRIDTRRVIYLITCIGSFIVTEIGRHVYRPLIYRNEISDLGIADSIGNMGGIVVQVFFGLALVNSNFKQGFRLIGFFIIGYIVYEILQPILPKGTFDWKDVYGTILGGVLSAIAFSLIQKFYKKNKILVEF